jgi:hypothetical protein
MYLMRMTLLRGLFMDQDCQPTYRSTTYEMSLTCIKPLNKESIDDGFKVETPELTANKEVKFIIQGDYK